MQMMLRRLRDALIWISGGALLLAVAVDALAMVGRQIQMPLIGSIEIVEALVLFASGGALIIATLDGAHARVNLLLERMPPIWRTRLERLHALIGILLFASLLSGTLWIAIDLWSGQEESELLHIPYRPLRIAAAVSLAVLLVLSILRIRRRGER
jgi:TRAP-type C4-dicarboxylate transport system permease small subunit